VAPSWLTTGSLGLLLWPWLLTPALDPWTLRRESTHPVYIFSLHPVKCFM